ncbi:MAG: hypothetical protein AAFV95_28520 [Bacteroidota bacterium]
MKTNFRWALLPMGLLLLLASCRKQSTEPTDQSPHPYTADQLLSIQERPTSGSDCSDTHWQILTGRFYPHDCIVFLDTIPKLLPCPSNAHFQFDHNYTADKLLLEFRTPYPICQYQHDLQVPDCTDAGITSYSYSIQQEFNYHSITFELDPSLRQCVDQSGYIDFTLFLQQ